MNFTRIALVIMLVPVGLLGTLNTDRLSNKLLVKAKSAGKMLKNDWVSLLKDKKCTKAQALRIAAEIACGIGGIYLVKNICFPPYKGRHWISGRPVTKEEWHGLSPKGREILFPTEKASPKGNVAVSFWRFVNKGWKKVFRNRKNLPQTEPDAMRENWRRKIAEESPETSGEERTAFDMLAAGIRSSDDLDSDSSPADSDPDVPSVRFFALREPTQ